MGRYKILDIKKALAFIRELKHREISEEEALQLFSKEHLKILLSFFPSIRKTDDVIKVFHFNTIDQDINKFKKLNQYKYLEAITK